MAQWICASWKNLRIIDIQGCNLSSPNVFLNFARLKNLVKIEYRNCESSLKNEFYDTQNHFDCPNLQTLSLSKNVVNSDANGDYL